MTVGLKKLLAVIENHIILLAFVFTWYQLLVDKQTNGFTYAQVAYCVFWAR